MIQMPQKKFGESIDKVVYFVNSPERDLFNSDLTWAYRNGLGKRRLDGSLGSLQSDR